MKTSFKSLFAVAALGASALISQAQPAPKILVVDIGTLFDKHYRTEEQTAKLKAEDEKAVQELERLNNEGAKLVEEYKTIVASTENPALNDEARKKAQEDAQKKGEEIRAKQNDVQAFRANTQRIMQQRFMQFRGALLEELAKLSSDIAKKKGCTLLVDKSGPTDWGISNIIYSDPAYDITDEVLAEINKTRPASSPAPAATPAPAAPKAATPAAPANGAPAIQFPGAKK